MDKININLYGGKGLFGGRETPLEAEITYCDKYRECSFYKQGKCFSAGRWKQNCKFGRKEIAQGYTSRAMKYHSFRSRYTEDECYNKLDEPNSVIGKIANIFVLNTGYLYEDEEKKTYCIDTRFGKSPLIYLPEEKFTNDLIKIICDAKPKTIFDREEIKSYQKEVVPRFLYELKTEFEEIYNRFIEEYPEYKEKELNFIGREAYIKTLKNGTEIIDCHNNKWIIENDEIVCYHWKTWLPFGRKTPTETRIKITDDMTCKVTNNNQVEKNTKFAD